MLRGVLYFFRQIFFWNYPRGSWQYDVLAVAILAFIFLTPNVWFQDDPRPSSVRKVNSFSEDSALELFWVESFAVADTLPAELNETLGALLRQRTGRELEILSVEPSVDEMGITRAYLVSVRP